MPPTLQRFSAESAGVGKPADVVGIDGIGGINGFGNIGRFCGIGGIGGCGGVGGLKPTIQLPPSFPRRRESRSVGAETYRIKRFLEILRSRFPLSWE